jgi:hypothetical protein
MLEVVLNTQGEVMREHLLVGASFLVLAASGVSPAWAGWGCLTPPGTDPILTWSPTETEARASTLRLCRSLHQGCGTIYCIGNFDRQRHAIDLWRTIIKYSD